MDELEKTLASWFSKLPSLPGNIKAILVKIAPILAILGLILSLPAIFVLIGLGSFSSSFSMGYAYGGGGTLALIFAIISVILLGLSFKGLKAHSLKGWTYLYYNALAGAAYSILRLDIVGLIIGTGISLYLLFQIRSSYH